MSGRALGAALWLLATAVGPACGGDGAGSTTANAVAVSLDVAVDATAGLASPLNGTALDEAGQPIAGARVSLCDSGRCTSLQTDSLGAYALGKGSP